MCPRLVHPHLNRKVWSDVQNKWHDNKGREYVCVIHCVVIPFILDVRLYTFRLRCGRTRRGHTGGRPHRSFFFIFSAFLLRCLPYFFVARSFQPFLSLVDGEVRMLCIHDIKFSPPVGHDVRENPGSCDCAEIRTHVPTSEGFEVTN